MNDTGKRLKIIGLVLTLVLLLGLAPFAQADDEPSLVCNPVAEALAAQMEIECGELLGMLDEEVGLGEVMQAWYLSQRLENFEGSWEDLLELGADTGWGQLVKAFTLADQLEGVEAEELLELKAEGTGWGQLWKAQAILLSSDDDTLTLDDALEQLDELGWGQIKKELEIAGGPPPWAKGGNGLAIGHNNDADGSTAPGNSGGKGNGNNNGNNGRGQGNGDG